MYWYFGNRKRPLSQVTCFINRLKIMVCNLYNGRNIKLMSIDSEV